MNEQTPEGLPVISYNLLQSYLRDFERETTDPKKRAKFEQEMTDRISEENPRLMKYIRGLTSHAPRGENDVVIITALTIYDLLRKQTESNKLEQLIDPPDQQE